MECITEHPAQSETLSEAASEVRLVYEVFQKREVIPDPIPQADTRLIEMEKQRSDTSSSNNKWCQWTSDQRKGMAEGLLHPRHGLREGGQVHHHQPLHGEHRRDGAGQQNIGGDGGNQLLRR